MEVYLRPLCRTRFDNSDWLVIDPLKIVNVPPATCDLFKPIKFSLFSLCKSGPAWPWVMSEGDFWLCKAKGERRAFWKFRPYNARRAFPKPGRPWCNCSAITEPNIYTIKFPLLTKQHNKWFRRYHALESTTNWEVNSVPYNLVLELRVEQKLGLTQLDVTLITITNPRKSSSNWILVTPSMSWSETRCWYLPCKCAQKSSSTWNNATQRHPVYGSVILKSCLREDVNKGIPVVHHCFVWQSEIWHTVWSRSSIFGIWTMGR